MRVLNILSRVTRRSGFVLPLARFGALTLLTAFGAQAKAEAAPELLGRGAEVAELCQRHLPGLERIGQTIKDAGFTYKGAWGRPEPKKIYAVDGFRVLIGTSLPSNDEQSCLVYVRGMTEAQALQLISPWLTAADAKVVKS